MPEYPFQSGKKIKYFFFQMSNAPSIGSEITDIDGKKWKRIIIEPPRAQVDSISKINPDSAEDFVKKTANHKGTYGDLLDLSKELSEQRAEKHGRDFLGEKHAQIKKEKMDARKARNRARKEKALANKKNK